jgi:hypothetical protein
MNIVFNIIGLIVGIVSGGIIITLPLTIVFFDIPYTFKMMRENTIHGGIPIIKCLISIIIYTVISSLIIWGIYSWLPDNTLAFWIGVSLGLIKNIKHFGASSLNMSNYLLENAQYFKK